MYLSELIFELECFKREYGDELVAIITQNPYEPKKGIVSRDFKVREQPDTIGTPLYYCIIET